MSGTRRIAMLMRQAARAEIAHRGSSGVVIGIVRKVSPDLRIQPMNGAIALPDEVLEWSRAAASLKADLLLGDTVMMTVINDVYHVIDAPDGIGSEIGSGGGGVSSHHDLTDLADGDDHPQYHNNARGDARYWPLATDLATQTELESGLALKAPVASPTFTGVPAAPTATGGTNTTQLATTAFVAAAIAPYLTTTAAAVTYLTISDAALTYLTPAVAASSFVSPNQLEYELGFKADYASVSLKADLASPVLTGAPSLPTGTIGVTQSAADNTTALATTAFVQTNLAAYLTTATAASTYAPIANPTFTGTVGLTGTSLAVTSAGTATVAVDRAATTNFASFVMRTATVDVWTIGLRNDSTNDFHFRDNINARSPLKITQTTGIVDLSGANDVVLTKVDRQLEYELGFKSDLGHFHAQYATLDSPVFTGTPSLPTGTIGVTQTASDNTTALATTAFVQTNLASYLTTSSASATYLTIATAASTYAPLASPSLTGVPVAPTATAGTSTTQLATTAFVTTSQANFVSWNQLEYELSFKSEVGHIHVDKADLVSPTFTGTPSLPTGTIGVTQSAADNTTALATTAFVQTNLASYLTTASAAATYLTTATAASTYAPLASPSLTGVPVAPTAAAGTSTTQIATTAFVTLAEANFVSQNQMELELGFKSEVGHIHVDKADLASPTFTGTPSLPTGTIGVTQSAADNTTALATTAFVQTNLASYLTTASASSTYAPLASPTFTGTPAAPTPSTADNTTKIATTAYVQANLVSYLTTATATSTYAPLASPTLTGVPVAPTAAAGTSTTQLATTAFVTTSEANFVSQDQMDYELGFKADIGHIHNEYVSSSALAGYLPLTGGTLSSSLNITDLSGFVPSVRLRITGDTTDRARLSANVTSDQGELAFGGGGAGGTDWKLTRTAADVATLTAGDKIRDTSDPIDPNDLARRSYVDLNFVSQNQMELELGFKADYASVSLKADLASPVLTGAPSLPTGTIGVTQSAADNTTALATTAFVQTNLSSYLTTATATSTYAPLASPTLTGVPVAPTATAGTSTTQIATTAFVTTSQANFVSWNQLEYELGFKSEVGHIHSEYALQASPTALSGAWDFSAAATVSVATASLGDNDTSAASTAFVQSALGNPNSTRPSCSLWHSATQSIPNATDTALLFDSEINDNDSMHSTTTNTSRITAQTPGTYTFFASVEFAGNATGYRQITLIKNGTDYLAMDNRLANAAVVTRCTIGVSVTLNAGDYVEVWAYQTSTAALNVSLSTATFPYSRAFNATWTGGTGTAAWGNASVSLTAPLISGAAQVVTAVETAIDNWQTETYDISGMHDGVTNPGRITISTPGLYEFAMRVFFAGIATTGFARVALRKNGTTTIAYGNNVPWNNSSAVGTSPDLTFQVAAVAGDYFDVLVFQNTGATRVWDGTISYFQATRVGYQVIPDFTGYVTQNQMEYELGFKSEVGHIHVDKADLASPTFTGIPAAPTAAAATNTTQIATTAFVTTADNLKADLASPTFTGTPAAPTAARTTNTTQLATTAFASQSSIALTAPSLGSGWAAYGFGFRDPYYAKSVSGVVSVGGMMASASVSTNSAFTLPASCCPSATLIFSCIATIAGTTQQTRVDITSGGVVTTTLAGSTVVQWLSLSGIEFQV